MGQESRAAGFICMTDEDFFIRARPGATIDEVEAFLERVAIKIANGIPEAVARVEALENK